MSAPRLGLALPMTGRGVDTRRLVAELTAEVQEAERQGFDLVLVPEHHGGPHHSINDPLSMVGWLLAATERIRVGPGVLVLPLHSVPRLAEQTAFLQVVSGGRLFVGVGAGYQAADFELFGVELAERAARMDAGLAALGSAWTTGSIDGHAVRPKLSGEAPPLFVGAWTAAGIRRAAQSADGWLADPIRTLEDTVAGAGRYRAAAEAAGRRPQVVVMREAWVGVTDDEAVSSYRPVIEPIFRYYNKHGALGPGVDVDSLTLPGGLSERVVCGSPRTVAASIGQIAARAGADTVVLGLRHPGGPEHSTVMAAIRLLGEQVRPLLHGATV